MSAHIASIPRMSLIAYERSWDHINHSFQSFCSTNGTISFDMKNGVTVGAFRNNRSERIAGYPQKSALDLFSDASEEVRLLAQKEALQYLLYSFEQKKSFLSRKKPDIVVPVITAAMWSEGDCLYSSDNEQDFLLNGGEYVDTVCVPRDQLVEYLTEDYELTDEELSFAELLYSLKSNGQTKLEKGSFDKIMNIGSSPCEEFSSALADFGIEIV